MQLVFAATTQVSQRVIAAQATSDEVLLESIANNGKAAMHVFYARHNAQIYKFIFRMVRDTSVAEDIVRQVFLDVWRNARQFEGRSQVSTWLHAIARSKALTALNRRRHEDIEQNNVREEPTPPEMSPNRGQTNAILLNCVAQLSPVHREIIDLFYYHEKSVEEVGEMIGIPQSTVKTRMFYARKQLVDLLTDAGIASSH
jgi:RNA polymerase sigma-70 factor (ECF subfamily)